jgi:hypothetical protein
MATQPLLPIPSMADAEATRLLADRMRDVCIQLDLIWHAIDPAVIGHAAYDAIKDAPQLEAFYRSTGGMTSTLTDLASILDAQARR